MTDRVNDSEPSAAQQQIIIRDLARLSRVRPGLGEAAAAYVLSGAGGTVLSSIATPGHAMAAKAAAYDPGWEERVQR